MNQPSHIPSSNPFNNGLLGRGSGGRGSMAGLGALWRLLAAALGLNLIFLLIVAALSKSGEDIS
jgi:hypothetical protein